MKNATYSEQFFTLHLQKSLSSAEHVIPIILDFIQPGSVIDIGCGNGTWLKVWLEKGIRDIRGVDGNYVNVNELLFDNKYFVSADLEKGYQAEKKYDLVTSLEVAEHIRPEFATTFIHSLCQLGDIIIFSAAIPGQEGTFHFNEQYPDYWARLFATEGFVAVDYIRDKIWDNNEISWWYRQNILCFVKEEQLSSHEKLQQVYSSDRGKVMNLVHPELLGRKTQQVNYFKGNLQNPVKTAGYYFKKMFARK